jgi:small glutamine-rich tetratricopeptide repeat-containing protein alpha
MFIKFLDSVKQRGMFEGVSEGSPEYNDRMSKVLGKFKEKFGDKLNATAAAPAPEPAPIPTAVPAPTPPLPAASSTPSIGDVALADSYKNKGNELLAAKKFEESIDAYSDAIKASSAGPNSHVYYSNRAAAYSQLCQYEEACADAESAVRLNSKYSKAHSRLGYAHYQLGRYSESIAAYRAALQLEPNNKDWQQALDNALRKEEAAKRPVGARSGGGGGGGGMPGGMGDLAGLMNNPALASMMGGAGGLDGIMSNPAFMQMAQQVMSNPAMMQSMMSMMGGGGGEGGLDMNAMSGIAQQMMSDPAMAASAANLAASMGGGAPGAPAPRGGGGGGATPNPTEMMERLRNSPELAVLRTDPELAPFFRDIETGGMSAAMRHMSNPAIMQKLMKAMQSMNSDP